MRAIVHSIHSQVPPTIEALGGDFAVLSLDSHLDVSLGGDYGVYPEDLRLVAQRTSVHSVISEILGGANDSGAGRRSTTRPGLIVAIPERMLTKHAEEIELRLPPAVRLPERESVSSVVSFLRASLNIDVYPSPPRRLSALVPRLNQSGRWLLDIDVDYMEEMQDECYTQIRKAAPGVLQSAKTVIDFVQASKPETITISEAMVQAIRDRGSNFGRFLGALRALGYSIEERGLYESDEEVTRGIEVCKEFYHKVSTRLLREHMDSMMQGDFAGFEGAERRAATEFFRRKGY